MNAKDLPTETLSGIDPDAFREALSCFATGVVVVTTLGPDGEPLGLTVDSFNSVSMDPPLVLWSLGLTAASLPAFRTHPAFIVNVLSDQQLALCKQFARPDSDKFAGVQWSAGLHGAPVLVDTAATLQCLNYRQYEGGDHEIFLGEVIDTTVTDKSPLIHCQGQFGRFGR